MSNLEHYFENLLFEGKDCRGDVNKNTLTKEEQEAVEICAQYVIYTLFANREGFKEFIHSEPKHAYVIVDEDGNMECSNCSSSNCFDNYCGHCGAKMDGGKQKESEPPLFKATKEAKRRIVNAFCPNCGAKMEV